ncbi:hypothetical protein B4Q13_15825 [Lacticaseibacillus rhamnosus]
MPGLVETSCGGRDRPALDFLRHRGARRDPAEDALLFEDLPGEVDGVLRTHLEAPVEHAGVEHRRDEALVERPQPVDEVALLGLGGGRTVPPPAGARARGRRVTRAPLQEAQRVRTRSFAPRREVEPRGYRVAPGRLTSRCSRTRYH